MNYLDKLFYPIMMSIRSLRNHFKSEQEANTIVLECQSKVEQLIFSTIHFILDLIVYGPNHTTLTLNKNVFNMKREFQNKMDCIQQFIQKGDVKQLIKNIQQFYEAQEGFSESESEDEELSLQIKLTGKIKEFNPEIQVLNQELQKKEAIIQQLKQKLKLRQNSMEAMAHNHHKEVSVLKAQFLLNPQNEDNPSIFNVKYFDQTSMLEPEVIALMNEKINDIKSQYERYVKQCMESLQKQRIQTPVKRETIDKQIVEYSSKELLKQALEKEQDPYMIIKNIQDLKSINYILNVFTQQEKKYGIDYERINQTFKTNNQDLQKLIDSRLLMEDCQSQISAQYLADLQKKKQEIFEINQLMQQQEIYYKEQVKQLEDTIKQQDNNQKLNDMILNQQEKIESLRTDNYNINTMLMNQRQYQLQLKQQNQFLMNNLKHIFNIIYPKYKNSINFDKMDIIKDKTQITKDILNKLKHLEGYDLFTLIQEIQLLLYQTESQQLINQIGNGRFQNKQTQTIIINQEQQNVVKEKKQKEKQENNKPHLKHLELFNQEKQKLQKFKCVQTQTENHTSIIIIEDEQQKSTSLSLNTILQQYQSNTQQDSRVSQYRNLTPDPQYNKNSVFEKLYTQQKYKDPRLHQLKPYIEKLSEEEFLEVLNTLELYSFRQQQSNLQTTTLDLPCYDVSLIQKSILSKNYEKKRHTSVDQTKNVFIELDEQREMALKLYEQQRINTYRRRIQRLVPVQPSCNLQIEEKIRPKSQLRGSSFKN